MGECCTVGCVKRGAGRPGQLFPPVSRAAGCEASGGDTSRGRPLVDLAPAPRDGIQGRTGWAPRTPEGTSAGFQGYQGC